MSISMRFALGERTMLETPILIVIIVIIVLVIAAVVWWLYRSWGAGAAATHNP
jgi:flagellar basal body-associated protein FliL